MFIILLWTFFDEHKALTKMTLYKMEDIARVSRCGSRSTSVRLSAGSPPEVRLSLNEWLMFEIMEPLLRAELEHILYVCVEKQAGLVRMLSVMSYSVAFIVVSSSSLPSSWASSSEASSPWVVLSCAPAEEGGSQVLRNLRSNPSAIGLQNGLYTRCLSPSRKAERSLGVRTY